MSKVFTSDLNVISNLRILSTINYDTDKESSCITEDEEMNVDRTSNK